MSSITLAKSCQRKANLQMTHKRDQSSMQELKEEFHLTQIQIGMWVKYNNLTKLALNHLRMVFKKLVHLVSGPKN